MAVPNKLSPEHIAKIKQLRWQHDVSATALAERFGVGVDTIRRAVKNAAPLDDWEATEHVFPVRARQCGCPAPISCNPGGCRPR